MLLNLIETPKVPEPPPVTGLAKALDRFAEALSPKWALSRLTAREQIREKFRYDAATPGRGGKMPDFLRSPNSPLYQMDAMTMARSGTELFENSVIVSSMAKSLATYLIGNATYLPDLGDETVNEIYRYGIAEWMQDSDHTGRLSFVNHMQIAISGGVVPLGGHGFIDRYSSDGSYRLQSIKADCIGNPRQLNTWDPHYVQGIELDRETCSRPAAYHIYRRDISENYQFQAKIDSDFFTFLNPIESTDQIRAVTPLHGIIRDAQRIYEIEDAWGMKIHWAGSKVAVVNSEGGGGPGQPPIKMPQFGDNNFRPRAEIMQHGQVTYGDPSTKITMNENATPTANEMEFYVNVIAKICLAFGMPLCWGWSVANIPGTLARAYWKQAERNVQEGPISQRWLVDSALRPIIRKAISSLIELGVLPYHKNWARGKFMFTAHPSLDEGNDSDSDLKENAQGMKSQATINAKSGKYWRDVNRELAAEAKDKLALAITTAADVTKETGVPMTWQEVMPHLQMMGPNPTQAPAPAAPTGEAKPEKSAKEEKSSFAKGGYDESKHDRNGDGEFAPSGGGSGGKSDKGGKSGGQKLTGAQKTEALKKKLEESRAKTREAHGSLQGAHERVAELHKKLEGEIKNVITSSQQAILHEMGEKIKAVTEHTQRVSRALASEDRASAEHGEGSREHQIAQNNTKKRLSALEESLQLAGM